MFTQPFEHRFFPTTGLDSFSVSKGENVSHEEFAAATIGELTDGF
jgi:hypothetical protein